MHDKLSRLTYLLTLTLFTFAAPTAGSSSAPGDAPRDMDELRQLIEAAVVAGLSEVLVPPGVYTGGPPPDDKVVLRLQNVTDLHVRAAGVTMRCTRLTRALELFNCRNVQISGLTIDYAPLPFTQGTIVAVAPDGGSVDVRIHEGYARTPNHRIDIIDPQTRTRKQGMPFLWGATATLVAEDVVRVVQPELGTIAAIGDLATLSSGPEPGMIPHGVTIEGPRSESNTFRDVTIHSAPGFGIFEVGGGGNLHLDRVRVVPGPPPGKGAEPRLLSVSWDAIQHARCRRGPLVENCEITHAGDDSWSVQCADLLLLARDGDRWQVAPRDSSQFKLEAGDRLHAADGVATRVTKIARELTLEDSDMSDAIRGKILAAGPFDYWKVSNHVQEVIVDTELAVAIGTSFVSPDHRLTGYTFRNNTCISPGRVLVKAAHGVIEGNTLVDSAGIQVDAEVPSGAYLELHDVAIRNNRLVRTHFDSWGPWSIQAGAMTVAADHRGSHGEWTVRPAGWLRDVRIENNTFEDSNGVSIVCTSTTGLVIRGNRIAGSHQRKPHPFGELFGIDQGAGIYLKQCQGVVLEGNTIVDPGPFMSEEVILTAVSVVDSSQAPSLTSLSPDHAALDGPSFTLTLTGGDFLPTARVRWTGQADLTPVTQSRNRLTVLVPAAYLGAAGTVTVRVVHPGPGGGTSAGRSFTVTALPGRHVGGEGGGERNAEQR